MGHGFSIVDAYREHLLPATITYYKEPLAIVRGKGSRVWDDDEREYLDFFGGILTVSVGHCNARVNEAIFAQAGKLQHASSLYATEPAARLAARLAELAPGRLAKSFFSNSGTEADETAILLAQIHTGCSDVIALRYGYSGRSSLGMALSAHAAWRVGTPAVPWIRHAHNAYCFRCPFRATYPECDLACARDVEELILTTTTGRVAAILVEPIQGMAGFITPPPGYFEVLREIVSRHGGLFIADEVQTGWGRTGGRWFGIEHWGVAPDIMTSAKGMANGAPIGWTIATPEVAASFAGNTISTFGGNPVSCAAADATIGVIAEDDLLTNAERMGDHLREGLLALQQEFPAIGDVRGMGLMQAVELVGPNKEPDPGFVERVFEETRARSLLIGKGGLHGNVLRLTPMLDVTKGEVDEALEILHGAIRAAASG